MRNEVLAEERDMERAGGHDMEGGGRVATRGESRVAEPVRGTGRVFEVLRQAEEVLRQAVSTASQTGVKTG